MLSEWERKIKMEPTSQKLEKSHRAGSFEMGTGWKLEDLSKPQIIIEYIWSTVIREADIFWIWSKRQDRVLQRQVVSEARYFCTDICDGEAQGHDGINYSLPSEI